MLNLKRIKSMKTMMMTIALLFFFMMCMTAQTNESKMMYNPQEENVQMTVAYTYENELDTLSQRVKNVYVYDQQGRVLMREVRKWNRRKQQWVNLKRWTYAYADGKMTVGFAIWNKRKQQYNPVKDIIEYVFISNQVFAVSNYKWNRKQQDLQLTDSRLLMKDNEFYLQTGRN